MKSRHKVIFGLLVLFLLLATNIFTYMVAPGRNAAAPDPAVEDEQLTGEEYSLLYRVIDLLTGHYLHPVDYLQLIEGAVKGAVNILGDPYTVFFNDKEMNEFLVHTLGTFGGIGVKIAEVGDGISIIEVIAGTPAERAGLHRGDRIYSVDGVKLTGQKVEKAVKLLRGKEGTGVTMEIARPGSSKPGFVTLQRETIQMQTVFVKWLEPGVGYIKITQFDGRTGSDFVRQLENMENEGLKYLVLDLRDNPGGLLSEAVTVARALSPAGEITRIIGRNGETREIFYSYLSSPKPYPMALLVNNYSASGAEILAGALQDHKAALLIGSKTAGKATVQNYKSFPEGGGIRYTVAKYVTPRQKDIHGQGIVPDYEIKAAEVFGYYRYLYPAKLERGSMGASVKLLQEMLNMLGYDLTPSAFFDRETGDALAQFQHNNGLQVDGVFDELTWLHLLKEIDEIILQKDPHILESVRLLKMGG